MAFVHSLSSVAAEDHQETNEEVDGVVVDSERVGEWIKSLLRTIHHLRRTLFMNLSLSLK